MDTQFFGLIGIGAILGIVVQHILQRGTIAAERIYNYKKEELLRYRQVSEKVIEKLMLLENHREILLKYLELSYQASAQESTVFIDLNNTFDKSVFETNQEQIATSIFLYFSSVKEDWNECLNQMGEIFNLVINIDMRLKNGGKIDWISDIEKFNLLNQRFGDIPWELSEKIKDEIILKEKEIIKQKPTFFIF